MQKINPCLWFDHQAEEAANFYTAIFSNSKIKKVTRYGKVGFEFHGKPEGSVMTVEFELDGQTFTALNGGSTFQFNEAISFQVSCKTQTEVDYYWERLSQGGDLQAQQCGWLKDKFGLSWQIVPEVLGELLGSGNAEKSQNVMRALLHMRKLEIAELQSAYDE